MAGAVFVLSLLATATLMEWTVVAGLALLAIILRAVTGMSYRRQVSRNAAV
jgi:hypothetical protein